MPLADEKSWLADPALWVAFAALGVSAYQACSSSKHNRMADKRTKFIESISVEFAKIENTLDSLEQGLVRAKRDHEISSSEIAVLAIAAMRSTTRSLNKVSGLNSVDEKIIDLKKFDTLDEIMCFANDGEFEGETRLLHLETSHKIVARVSVYCTELHREIQGTHL